MSLNTAAVADSGKDINSERTRLYPAPLLPGYSNGQRVEPSPEAPASGVSSDIEQSRGGQAEDDADDGEEGDDDVKKAAVFGALDGVLTSFAIVAGAAGGALGTQAVLIVGISSIIANALSMGLGEYLSTKAMNEYMAIERKREEWELATHRQGEVDNMVQLYMRRGMSREDAQEVSSRLSKYDDCFVDAMMVEEIGSYGAAVDEGGSIREGVIAFLSFSLAGLLPLLVYALSGLMSSLVYDNADEFVSQSSLFLLACLVTAAVLFAIGVVKSTFVSRSWLGSGMETLVLGSCCAGLAYEIAAAVAACVEGMV